MITKVYLRSSGETTDHGHTDPEHSSNCRGRDGLHSETFPRPFRAVHSLYCVHYEEPCSAPKVLHAYRMKTFLSSVLSPFSGTEQKSIRNTIRKEEQPKSSLICGGNKNIVNRNEEVRIVVFFSLSRI